MDDAGTALAEWLADLKNTSYAAFNVKDDKGRGLDCLKVVQSGGKYLGIHHTLRDGAFDLNLVESDDLKAWRHLRTLDRNAHQGTLRPCAGGWLAAWEKDGTPPSGGKGNWIRVAWYPNLEALKAGIAQKTIDLPRLLSQFAEGTPHFSKVPPNPLTGEIEIGFHYYRNGDVDRQAFGVLRRFSDWKAQEVQKVNRSLEPTYKGNIGDRDQFQLNLTQFTMLEAQLKKEDWSSWRILLRAGEGEYNTVPFRTPGKSTSFANPSITRLTMPNGEEALVLSLFLPSQGNAPSEAGQMLAIYPLRMKTFQPQK